MLAKDKLGQDAAESKICCSVRQCLHTNGLLLNINPQVHTLSNVATLKGLQADSTLSQGERFFR